MNKKNTPTQEIYDDHYFEQSCGGYEEFKLSKGDVLSPWTVYTLNLANLQPADKVLDVGTGRGEMVYQSAKAGCLAVGLDYASSAIYFAKILRRKSETINNPFDLILADGRNLPFSTNQFSVVFMCDIVEHLSQNDLEMVLKRVYHCLLPNGRLIIHTMPNLNYYKFGYPIFRTINLIFGKKLPKDPRDRFYRGETHINIQTQNSLRLNLETAGFNKISVELKQLSGKRLKRIFCQLPVLKHVLSNDIIAIGIKNEDQN